MTKYILINTVDKNFIKPIFDENETGLIFFSPKNIKLEAQSTTIIPLNCTFHSSNKINIYVSELASFRARHIFLNSNTKLQPNHKCLLIFTNYGEISYHIKQGQKFLKLCFHKIIKPKLLIKHTYINNSKDNIDTATQKRSIDILSSGPPPPSPTSPPSPSRSFIPHLM